MSIRFPPKTRRHKCFRLPPRHQVLFLLASFCLQYNLGPCLPRVSSPRSLARPGGPAPFYIVCGTQYCITCYNLLLSQLFFANPSPVAPYQSLYFVPHSLHLRLRGFLTFKNLSSCLFCDREHELHFLGLIFPSPDHTIISPCIWAICIPL